MRLLGAIFLLVSVIGLFGCTVWPPAGQGGMAEHRLESLTSVSPDQPLGPEHGLRFEFDLVLRHLDVLVLEGAELCFPATVAQAKQRQDRITRELLGGLEFVAANDLTIQTNLLARLEGQLDYVKQHDVCLIPVIAGQETPQKTATYIYDLLNSDNQFAFDSSEINPKYLGRLAEAAQLVAKQPDYHLYITGHADAIGEQAYNHELAIERAHKVGRYLQILGIPAERMKFDTVGSEQPLFNANNAKNQSHVRLVNRRVSIELVEVPRPTR
ncbi:MAG: OmpA family protein [Gammaproteobacteria bacterium]